MVSSVFKVLFSSKSYKNISIFSVPDDDISLWSYKIFGVVNSLFLLFYSYD